MYVLNFDCLDKIWRDFFIKESHKPYFRNISAFLKKQDPESIMPKKENVFKAFELVKFSDIKVVLLGQDPYHNKGQAHGLSFSVENNILPPSLKNIFAEVENNFDIKMPKNYGNLSQWARQGVLLLNSILTVTINSPSSHSGIGWEIFTDSVISKISMLRCNVVFILWGSFARQKTELIDASKHLVLTAPHPSPFSANKGFFNCKHFLKTNEFLLKNNLCPIQWPIKGVI